MASKTPTGIRVRHSRSCAATQGGSCACTPTFEAWAWSPRDGKKIRETFTTISAAKGWRSDATSAVRRGKMRAPKPTTVAQEVEAWIAKAERGEVRARGSREFKPAVRRLYTADLRRYVIPALGPIRVAQLRRADVQTYLVDDMLGKGLSGSRVHGVLNALRAVLRRPISQDELLANPTQGLDLPATGESRDRAALPAEATRLLASLPEEDRPLWAVAFYAGLRRGEIRGLRDEDVDLDANLINVRRGWDEIEGAIPTKSEKGERQVPVPAMLRRYLLEHRARTGRRDSDLFFGRTAGAPFTPTHIRDRALKAWAANYACGCAAVVDLESCPEHKDSRLEPIGLHECRHTYVSLMHAAGRSLEEIGDYVGHTSAYMTDKDRHLIEGQRQEAAAAFDANLARGSSSTQ
jgi:integrase